MVSLRRMTEAEFDGFLATSIPEYAGEKVKAGNWTADEALAKSRETYNFLLPEGLHSPHQHLYTIEFEGQPAGRVWLSTEPQGTAMRPPTSIWRRPSNHERTECDDYRLYRLGRQ